MNESVWQYQLAPAGVYLPWVSSVNLPVGAKILSVGIRSESIYVWAQVKMDIATEYDSEFRVLEVYGTGNNFIDVSGCKRIFIGTVFDINENAYHIYERVSIIE